MIENIAYSGGGIKGYAYIGVMKYLEENKLKDSVLRVSGTSIGAIFALLQVVGFNSMEIQKFVTSLNLQKLGEIDLNLFMINYGLDDGSRVTKLLKFLLKDKKLNENITFKQLFEVTKKELHISACDITKEKLKVFNHLLTPDISVVFACRCSISIPFIFTPVDEKYIDGCFSKNLLIDIFPIENTIGFHTQSKKSEYFPEDLQGYISRIVSCSTNKGVNLEIEKYKLLGYNVVTIPVTIKALHINISKEEIISQISIGYSSCINTNLNK